MAQPRQISEANLIAARIAVKNGVSLRKHAEAVGIKYDSLYSAMQWCRQKENKTTLVNRWRQKMPSKSDDERAAKVLTDAKVARCMVIKAQINALCVRGGASARYVVDDITAYGWALKMRHGK